MTDQQDPPKQPDSPVHDQPIPPLPGHVLDLLENMMIEIENARQVPLSNSVMISQEEVLDDLARIQKELPEELRAARWMVREREAYIARTNETARGVIAEAKKKSDVLVSESHIVQEAVEEANTLVRNAESESRRIRLESEDFAERQLAEAETVLGELLRYVREARAELHQALPPAPEPPISQ